MADPGTYRPAVEVKAYQAIDPLSITIRNLELKYPTTSELAKVGSDNISRLTDHMLSQGHLEDEEIEVLKAEVQKIVDDAIEFSLRSGQPSMEDAWRHLNCNRHREVLI
jgi:pyruvate dehydrogenase E1 component alpha subunit